MSDKSRLLPSTSNIQADISNLPADVPDLQPVIHNYGSIQEPSTSESENMPLPDDQSTLKTLEKIGFSLGHV